MQDSKAHISRIMSLVENPMRFKELDKPEWTAWRPSAGAYRRCVEEHRLDPSAKRHANVISQHDIRRHKEMMGRELNLATNELDNLFLAVRSCGYSVALVDRHGLTLLERSDYNSEFYCASDRPGSIWSESVGGTNGVGTAIAEHRPLAVYLGDHFFSELINIACVGVPIFDADDQMLGAINLSVHNPGLLEQTHRLIFEMACVSARRIEEQLFYDRYNGTSILRVGNDDGPAALLAIGPDQQILKLNRPARKLLAVKPGAPSGSLWDHFDRKYQKFSIAADDHARFAMRHLENGKLFSASTFHPTLLEGAEPKQAPAVSRRAAQPLSHKAAPSLAACAGGDTRMQAQIRLLQRVRATSLPILLLGETGVGKDTMARAIHAEGDRPKGPFVALNCAAIPESMIDSELFGYGAGAFTGARKEGNVGRVVEADGGTLFLDEIGDMPWNLQTRLLRVLESGEVSPLGSGKIRHVDLRVIAATNQELEQRVAEGKFRQDLYYRLAGLVLTLSPLREREDIELLASRILHSLADEDVAISAAAMLRIKRHSWPGNLRELHHVLQRAAKLAEHGMIEPDDLMLPATRQVAASPTEPLNPSAAPLTAGGIMENAERGAIETTLHDLGGDIDLCARKLGISRATLYRKLRAHGIRIRDT